MHVEKLKYIIWAKDMARAVKFYREVFDAEITGQSDVLTEFVVAGSTIGIHSGGAGLLTWTGLSFQVKDLFGACTVVEAAGGTVLRPPKDTSDEPAHLATCTDTEANEFRLTKPRGTPR